jgi:hypothetical protein
VACRDRVDQGLQRRGGGALDHTCHQCCSAIRGESQARTARSARGQDGAGGVNRRAAPLSAAGLDIAAMDAYTTWQSIQFWGVSPAL